jgi:hypothetical protein
MVNVRRLRWASATCLTVAALTSAAAAQKSDKDAKELPRPKITLRAQPIASTSPSRVTLTAEIVGGPNDNEEYYCPTVEWEWGDGTRSEASSDCEPYVAGESKIARRFTVAHVFRAGSFHITFNLKRREKVFATAGTSIHVTPGLGERDQ